MTSITARSNAHRPRMWPTCYQRRGAIAAKTFSTRRCSSLGCLNAQANALLPVRACSVSVRGDQSVRIAAYREPPRFSRPFSSFTWPITQLKSHIGQNLITPR
jgi:hypothetical protein